MSSNIFYGVDTKSGKIKSIFDVDSGLDCDCSCISCGRQLVAYKGKDKIYHFQHSSGRGCDESERLSLAILTKRAYLKRGSITVPDVSSTFGNKSKPHKFSFNSIEITKDNEIVLMGVSGDKLYLRLITKRKATSTEVNAYRKKNLKVLEIRVDSNYLYGSSKDELENSLRQMLNSKGLQYKWLSHPEYNKALKLLETSGVCYSNSSGLKKVLCPQSEYIKETSECDSCPYLISKTRVKLQCRGNLSKEDLLLISPSTIFPPENTNYSGNCKVCGSSDTFLVNNSNNFLVRRCRDCNNYGLLKCPLCDGDLSLKTNKDSRFDSYGSQFVGCESCSFTLTYKTSSGDFADEVRLVGGLDNIYKDKNQYNILIKYRKARKRV